jgi:putative ABC transport system permease protein
MSTWLRYFAFWKRNPRLDARDEIGFHLDMRVKDLMATGLSLEQARDRARSEFGNPDAIQLQLEHIDTRMMNREARSAWRTELARDIRVGLRSLRNSPAFTVAAVLCAGLGIGVTAAIVSAANSILVRPLPFRDADQLVTIYAQNTERGYDRTNIGWPDYESWRAENRVFTGIGIWTWSSYTLSADNLDAERVEGAEVASNVLTLFGVQPARGRLFVEGEDRPGAPRVAVMSDRLWRRRFGADSAIVGKDIIVDGRPVTVVGVMPPGFNFPSRGDLWTPFQVDGAKENRNNRYFGGAVGRLKPGVTVEQGVKDLARVDASLIERYPDNKGWAAQVLSMREDLVGDLRQPLKVFLWAVGLVLIMVCANVANLLLARGATRSREIAVRTALGASRTRLARQLLTESFLVAGMGALLGIVIAWWGVSLLRFGFPNATPPYYIQLSLDGSTLLTVLVIAVVTGLLFGTLPSIRGTHVEITSALREGSRGSADGLRRSRLRSSLVVAEVAVSVMLMIGALLLMRSYRNLTGTELGFDEKGIVSARISLPGAFYPTRAHSLAFYERLFERLQRTPGVTMVGSAQGIPFSGWQVQGELAIEGRGKAERGQELVAHYQTMTPSYLKAIGVPLLAGRWFTEADRDSTAPSVVVNQALVKKAFPNEDPIGKRVSVSGDAFATIVGVTRDFRQYGLSEPMGPAVFYTYQTWPGRTQTVVLRTTLEDPSILIPAIRAAVREIDPRVAIFQARTFEEVVSQSLWRQRLQGNVLGIFAALALALSCIGLYGVISYAVAQRTRELGVRIALGATRRSVLMLVFGQSGRLVLGGIVVGLVGAYFGVRLLETLLYGVEAKDLTTFATVPLVLGAVALLASLVPARRASRVDPIIAMRAE